MPLQKPEKFETSLETYRVKKVLGEGGSGRVFLAHDVKGQDFAVKCLLPELVSTEKVRRFKNELTFSQKNTHPNILTVLDHGFLPSGDVKIPFYIMPYYPSTLRKLLGEGLTPERSYELFQKILDGVEEAHRRGIWHRDLKPENVLVNPETSSIVIADFGIAHFSEEELYTAVMTQQAERLANFQYAAPEQRVRGRQVDNRADIYALGLILVEMFTGEIPLGTEFTKISGIAAAFGYLDDIVDRMIRQSPNHRPGTINEIRLELAIRQGSRRLAIPKQEVSGLARQITDQRAYRAEVDCIGRIENDVNPTVLSISAGLSYSLSIPASEKARILAYIADAQPGWGSTRRFVLLYTLLLFILIKDHIRKLDIVVIDPEYTGYEPLIKQMLLQLLRSTGMQVKAQQISFQRVDRQSPARIMASRVYKGSADPDLIIGAKQIADLVPKKKIGVPGFNSGRRT